MKDFRKLDVWQKAHALALSIYSDTRDFPSDERYGITNQLRRACFSIPTNMAEGCGRYSDSDLCRFLDISMGSANETEYLLLLSRDLGMLSKDNYNRNSACLLEVKRMLASLIKKVRFGK